MAKIKDYGEGRFAFNCPGCGNEHVYFVNSPHWTKDSQGWQFNGDMEKPTFTPSLLNTWGTFADPNWKPDADAGPNHSGRCHLFVTNGMIDYYSDSTHHLAGQTIPLPEIN